MNELEGFIKTWEKCAHCENDFDRDCLRYCIPPKEEMLWDSLPEEIRFTLILYSEKEELPEKKWICNDCYNQSCLDR